MASDGHSLSGSNSPIPGLPNQKTENHSMDSASELSDAASVLSSPTASNRSSPRAPSNHDMEEADFDMEEFMRQNPELYGLRRSVRAFN